jgi:hypothetical protein
MAKQLKKFCRITKYIEKTDPKLYEILDDLCVMGAFRPRRGHNGTTFIWPSKDTIAKLDKMRYTEDIDKGCDIVLAHIVHDFLPNAAAWNAKKSDIPNGSNRKLEVKAVTGSKVTLVDGAELEHDDKFKTFRPEGQTQAVWRITKGSLDHTKHTKSASFEHARQGAPPRKHAEGGTAHKHRWHRSVGGSLISAVVSGGSHHAVAPFGQIVAFSKFLEKKADLKLITELRLIASPEMITTSAFMSRADSKMREALDDFRASPDAKSASRYGQGDYVKMMDEGYAALMKKGGKSGGAPNLSEALSQAFNNCRKSSEKALAGLDLHADFTVDLFTALNLSRAMEFACLRNIPKNEQLYADKAAEIKELIEVIEGRAAGHKGLETDASSQSMGQLIASVFVAVDKFSKGPYVTYPFNAKKAIEDGKKQLKALYGPDNSLSAQLAKLSPDELSTLFSNLAPSEESEEIKEELQEERTEAIEDEQEKVEAPEGV